MTLKLSSAEKALIESAHRLGSAIMHQARIAAGEEIEKALKAVAVDRSLELKALRLTVDDHGFPTGIRIEEPAEKTDENNGNREQTLMKQGAQRIRDMNEEL